MMTLIAEGSGEDDEASDVALRRDAVDTYTALLETNRLPSVLMETMSWVLGEYAYLSNNFDLNSIISKLCVLARRPKIGQEVSERALRKTSKRATTELTPQHSLSHLLRSAQTRRHLTTAVMKLVSQAGTCPPLAAHLIDDFTKSADVDLQVRKMRKKDENTRDGSREMAADGYIHN